MVLKTLEVLGPLHGYGIARRIEQISGELLTVNQGLYGPARWVTNRTGVIGNRFRVRVSAIDSENKGLDFGMLNWPSSAV
jgi:hypothetical protein